MLFRSKRPIVVAQIGANTLAGNGPRLRSAQPGPSGTRRCTAPPRVGFFRETRHQFSKQNQSLRGKMSGMAGFSRMREVLRKRAAFFFVHGRGRPASTFGLQLDSKPRVRRGLVSVSL